MKSMIQKNKDRETETMKYTICITRECNLRCQYCYIEKKKSVMPIDTAQEVIEFIFKNTPPEEKFNIGFFGGEPLLEFELIKALIRSIKTHPLFNNGSAAFTVVSNGTIFSDEIADFLVKQDITFGISCDGPPEIQDMFRYYPGGQGSSTTVESTIRRAIEALPSLMVNAVYHPRTISQLPRVVDYFSSLGIRQIYLTPDFSAPWSKKETELLPGIYKQVAQQYIDYYLEGDPHYISLIDSKVAVILKDGHKPADRCTMGKGEFAFAPSGNVYPCERLIGSDDGEKHCIGNIFTRLEPGRMCRQMHRDGEINPECKNCSISDFCMNWCGCSNYFSSGYYNRVGPFLCASEKTSILTAFDVFQTLENRLGAVYIDYLTRSQDSIYSQGS